MEQLNAKLSELKAGPDSKKKFVLHEKEDIIIDSEFLNQNTADLPEIVYHDFILRNKEPDNFVLTERKKIFQITEIKKQHRNIVIEGYECEKIIDVFQNPCKSSDIGIMELGSISKQKK